MKRDNITKNDVLKEIHSNLGIPIIFLQKILHSILEIITNELNTNNKMKISGFGTFKILNKKSRIEEIQKQAKNTKLNPERQLFFTLPQKLKIKLMIKNRKSYKSIGEVAKEISTNTHTLRFWEKEFKQIKPMTLTGNRRYYSKKDITVIKIIHELLKKRGYTIAGVKKLLNESSLNLDEILIQI